MKDASPQSVRDHAVQAPVRRVQLISFMKHPLAVSSSVQAWCKTRYRLGAFTFRVSFDQLYHFEKYS